MIHTNNFSSFFLPCTVYLVIIFLTSFLHESNKWGLKLLNLYYSSESPKFSIIPLYFNIIVSGKK